MTAERRVVITGAGVVCPIGVGMETFQASLAAGRSGVANYQQFDASHMPVQFGAEVNDFDAKQYVKPRKSLKVMCKEIRMAVAAAAMALGQAEIGKGTLTPDRFGVVLGSEMHYGTTEDVLDVCAECNEDGKFVFSRWGDSAMSNVHPLWMLEYLPNMSACHIAIGHEAYGPNNSIGSGDASSLLAMVEAANTITRDHADVIIAGGTGCRINMTTLLFRGFSNLSHRNDDPMGASRPFGRGRDGMVNGEGAAAIILEDFEHAKNRGVNVRAIVAGYGRTFAPGYPDNIDFRSAIRGAIEQALRSADLSPEEIGHVNAHGLSAVNEDEQEALAINDVLGDVPVIAPKSYFGNLGAGGGSVELLATLTAFETGILPATLNCDPQDSTCPINVVTEPTPCDKPAAILLNYSATGQVAAVALRRPE